MSVPFLGFQRGHEAYQILPLYDLNTSSPHASSVYRMRRYKWRTFLNILGPSLVLGFYSFICFHFLANPPVNNIVPSTPASSRWAFYTWIVSSVFILDWARSALANLEATALMNPKVAPQSAMELMWHADTNWNNILWWLRAGRNNLYWLLCISRKKSHRISRPGGLWWALSSVTFLIFVALPLSGLTMELTEAYMYNTKKVLFVGPTSDTFNFLEFMDLPNQIRASWRSGRPTTPSDSSILYAINGSSDVSTTYYHDRVLNLQSENADSMIQIFAGPAVHETVVGSAWGLSANIICRPIPKDQLKLINVHDFNEYSLKEKYEDTEKIGWLNETGLGYQGTLYSLVVAADGSWYGDPPYCNISNHDFQTLDNDTRPLADVTTGVLEAYLWQGIHRHSYSTYEDRPMDQLLHHPSEIVSVGQTKLSANYTQAGENVIIPVAGFGVHCEVTSAVGTADVNPAHRTFSSFQRGSSVSLGNDQMAYPVQVQALRAIADYDADSYSLNPRDPSGPDSTWVAAHFSIGILPEYDNTIVDAPPGGFDYSMVFPALTPANLTTAMYKLLGESVIALMGPGTHNSTYGDLYGLTRVTYLKPGIIPWRIVWVMLALWTSVLVSASLWMAFNRRWASSLSAFEFFKFGAQYPVDVSGFSSTRFEECGRLRNIPGMVGTLPGEGSGGREGFIGLSNEVAMKNGRFVFDRAKAGMNTRSLT